MRQIGPLPAALSCLRRGVCLFCELPQHEIRHDMAGFNGFGQGGVIPERMRKRVEVCSSPPPVLNWTLHVRAHRHPRTHFIGYRIQPARPPAIHRRTSGDRCPGRDCSAPRAPDRVASILTDVQGVLLPGSGFDVDPERYGEKPISACGPADAPRTAVDELFLQDAFNLGKPILAICHGAQTLNVWRNGTLVQDLESVLHTPVNHRPGRDVIEAHPVAITPDPAWPNWLPAPPNLPAPRRTRSPS